VTRYGGAPFPGVTVEARPYSNSDPKVTTVTLSDGSYSLSVPMDADYITYALYFIPPGPPYVAGYYSTKYPNMFDPFDLGSPSPSTDGPTPIEGLGDKPGIDVQIQRQASLRGLVLGPDGKAAVGVTVTAETDAWEGYWKSATTDASGKYTLAVLESPTGVPSDAYIQENYSLDFNDPGGPYLNGTFNAGSPYNFMLGSGPCTYVLASNAGTVVPTVRLTTGHYIRGTISGSDTGAKLAGVRVEVGGLYSAYMTTGANGAYALAVPAGSYTIALTPDPNYFGGYYSSGGIVDTSDDATPIVTTYSDQTVNIVMPAKPPWAVTLEASDELASVGGTVTLTATATRDVVDFPYSIVILNSSGTVVRECYEGKTCQVTLKGVTAKAVTYHAVVGNPDGTSPITSSKPVVVTWGLDHMVISPSEVTISAGLRQSYAAEGYDASNADIGDVTASTMFSIDGGGSCVDTSCVADTSGDYTVTGEFGIASSTATLHAVKNTFHPIVPVRLLDSRIGNGTPSGTATKLTAGVPMKIQITGRTVPAGYMSVPAGASAITANVTIVKPSAASSVYLGPDPVAHPTAFTINFNKLDVTAYGSTIALNADGSISATYMAASGAADMVIDVAGYFTPDGSGGTYHPVPPARILDSRHANGLSGKFKANVPRTFTVWGRGGVLAGATAVTGNLTVTNATGGYAAYIGPAPLAKPLASTVNFVAGQTRANSVTVSLSPTGTLSVTYLSSGKFTADMVFDVSGYYTSDLTGRQFVPLSQSLVLDTRVGTGLSGRFAANTPRTFAVWDNGGVPESAVSVTGIVAVYNQTNSWALYFGTLPVANPSTSSLNFVKGDNCSNGVTLTLSDTGQLSATYLAVAGNTANLVMYVTGYFAP